jgi:hypothetical protein
VKGAEFRVCPHFEYKLSLGVSIGSITGSRCRIILPAPEARIMRMLWTINSNRDDVWL